MTLYCPDCHKKFYLGICEENGFLYLDMLAESMFRNPYLKIVCSECGTKIHRADALKRYMKRQKRLK